MDRGASLPSILLSEYLQGLALDSYARLAYLTLMVYDHTITLDVEVAQIWSDFKWTLPTCLFILNRYITPAMFIFEATVSTVKFSDSFCRIYGPLQIWPTLIALAALEAMMALRVCAVYANNKLIRRIVFSLYFCVHLTVAAFAVWASIVQPPTNLRAAITTRLPGCYVVPPSLTWLFWICPLAFEGLLLILTSHRLYKLKFGRPKGHLYFVFTRDTSLYFVVIFGGLFVCFVDFHYFLTPEDGYTAFLVAGYIKCVTASRMALNLRSAACGRPDATRVTQSGLLSSLHFRSGADAESARHETVSEP